MIGFITDASKSLTEIVWSLSRCHRQLLLIWGSGLLYIPVGGFLEQQEHTTACHFWEQFQVFPWRWAPSHCCLQCCGGFIEITVMPGLARTCLYVCHSVSQSTHYFEFSFTFFVHVVTFLFLFFRSCSCNSQLSRYVRTELMCNIQIHLKCVVLVSCREFRWF